MNAKQASSKSRRTNQRTNLKADPRKTQRTGQRRASNVRVLRPKKRARLNYGRVIMLGIILYFIVWTIYPITFRAQQGQEIESLKRQLHEINKQNNQLSKDVQYLQSDAYVEQEARSLGLSKPDEEVLVVIPQDSKKPLKGKENGVEKNRDTGRPASLWQRIVGVFTGVL
ncbi:MAG: FtsB family cell division protein [Candidatus Aquicultor sp.]